MDRFMVKKDLIAIGIMGGVYVLIEVLFDIVKNLVNGNFALTGGSSFWMFLVGGLSAFIIGRMNENPYIYRKPIWLQCAMGLCIVLIFEYVSGYYCNIYHHWGLWDYSNIPFNVDGQICLRFAICWYLLIPFGIWLDDFIFYILFRAGRRYGVLELYQSFFKPFEW